MVLARCGCLHRVGIQVSHDPGIGSGRIVLLIVEPANGYRNGTEFIQYTGKDFLRALELDATQCWALAIL
ncbi:hypothetical protein D3C85_1399220 [compost metagenome]